MSGINYYPLYCSTQIRSNFRDDLGNEKQIIGTGFCVATPKLCFVTNKHNLDPRLKLGNDTPYKLFSAEILTRKFIGSPIYSMFNQPWNIFGEETKFVEIPNINLIIHSETADVSVIPDLKFSTEYGVATAHKSEIADTKFFNTQLSIMDNASFFGFAGDENTQWWDTSSNLPIARNISIASLPRKPFINPNIKTSDVLLVSGLSFAGSSGSLVVSHEKNAHLRTVKSGPETHIPPKIIGIMSGHWWEKGSEPAMFIHSGLSYFTRSTAILELLGKLN